VSKYSTLVRILDQIRQEAAGSDFVEMYCPAPNDFTKINQARSRAFIHLYLKVGFGLLDFKEREHYVTDGTADGGIDGYYINSDDRVVTFIQSKFRTTENNFEAKRIELEEILAMEIDRIIQGEEASGAGLEYNGKIKRLMRELSQIKDIGRYTYEVVLIANVAGIGDAKLRQLVGGLPVDVIDHERCYDRLVFPVLAGTFFNASDLSIHIDLSNKSAGSSKIGYSVTTAHGECEITVLFVPTIEIARIMGRYKNSILRFNPRSYLELEGHSVNDAIQATVQNRETNEFALFNNGITMLSDETHINEKIGQKNKAQLVVTNPQIINGGQTAYALSRLLEDLPAAEADKLFEGKEVLLKVITVASSTAGREDQKLTLIEDISTATNRQTPVIGADRLSNAPAHLSIQRALFDRYGLLYERKRGEFADGVYQGYIDSNLVVERNWFFRIYLASNGEFRRAAERKLFVRYENADDVVQSEAALDRFYFGYLAAQQLDVKRMPHERRPVDFYAKIFAVVLRYMPSKVSEFEAAARAMAGRFPGEWQEFTRRARDGRKWIIKKVDRVSGEVREGFDQRGWMQSEEILRDLVNFFSGRTASPGA